MNILIDGYNLLCGAGIVADAAGPYSLEKSRRALLHFLQRVLPPEERCETTVVFDAKNAPRNLPRFYVWQTIQIVFAESGQEADDVIAELIRQHNSPKQLTVVSSDHAVQRAARRRRATFVDSDEWFRDRVRQRQSCEEAEDAIADPATVKIKTLRHGPLNPEEVAVWLAEFDSDELDGIEDHNVESTTPKNIPTSTESHKFDEPAQPIWNPFPDGYGEDLLDEDL